MKLLGKGSTHSRRTCASLVFVFVAVLAASVVGQRRRSVKPLPKVTIDGVLLKSDGKPRQYMELQLVPVESMSIVNDSRLIGVSNVKGKFEFRDVPDGRYTMSVKFGDKPTELSPYSTFYFPSTENRKNADVFEINADTKLRGLTFKLPPELVNRRLSGRVVWEDNGEPVPDAWVGCVDIDFDFGINFGNNFTRPDGTFELAIYTGRRYQAAAVVVDVAPTAFPGWAFVNVIGGGETSVFRPEGSAGPIEIKLKRFQGSTESEESKRLVNKYVGANRPSKEIFSEAL